MFNCLEFVRKQLILEELLFVCTIQSPIRTVYDNVPN